MDNIKPSNFRGDLLYGEEAEVYVNKLLTSPITKVECKRDGRWKDTGNLYVEAWCWSQTRGWYPSGIQAHEMSHWSFVLEEMVVTVPLEQLKRTIRKYGKPSKCDIPPNPSKGFLIKLSDLIQEARN